MQADQLPAASDPAAPVAAMAPEPIVGEKRPLEEDAAGPPAAAAAAEGEAQQDTTAPPAAAVVAEVPRDDEAPLKKQQTGRPAGKAGPMRETVYRLLAPSKHAGFVIGKGGAQIKELREGTGARIKVMEGVMGSDERPIVISSKSNDTFEECPAQTALLAIYHKILEADSIHGAMQEPGKDLPVRALVAQSQAGSLIGKAGVFIKQVRESSGADIRVLKPEELPLCALSNDRVVQISGTRVQIEAALKTIALKLWESPPREAPGGPPPALLAALGQQPPLGAADPSMMAMAGHHQMPGMMGGVGMPVGPYGAPVATAYQGMAPPAGMGGSSQTRTLMVPNQHVGLIIGSGGSNIKDIREKSGAQVKVHQQVGPPDANGVRQVEITGLPHQISMAESLIHAAGQRHQAGAGMSHQQQQPGQDMPQQQHMWGMA